MPPQKSKSAQARERRDRSRARSRGNPNSSTKVALRKMEVAGTTAKPKVAKRLATPEEMDATASRLKARRAKKKVASKALREGQKKHGTIDGKPPKAAKGGVAKKTVTVSGKPAAKSKSRLATPAELDAAGRKHKARAVVRKAKSAELRAGQKKHGTISGKPAAMSKGKSFSGGAMGANEYARKAPGGKPAQLTGGKTASQHKRSEAAFEKEQAAQGKRVKAPPSKAALKPAPKVSATQKQLNKPQEEARAKTQARNKTRAEAKTKAGLAAGKKPKKKDTRSRKDKKHDAKMAARVAGFKSNKSKSSGGSSGGGGSSSGGAASRGGGGKKKAAAPKVRMTGPRGGRFYLSDTGQKVYGE